MSLYCKLFIVVLLLLIGGGLVASQAVWEGLATEGDAEYFPASGQWALSSQFATGTILYVTNTINNRRIRVHVFDRNPQQNYFILLSAEAAKNLGIASRSSARVSVALVGASSSAFNNAAISSSNFASNFIQFQDPAVIPPNTPTGESGLVNEDTATSNNVNSGGTASVGVRRSSVSTPKQLGLRGNELTPGVDFTSSVNVAEDATHLRRNVISSRGSLPSTASNASTISGASAASAASGAPTAGGSAIDSIALAGRVPVPEVALPSRLSRDGSNAVGASGPNAVGTGTPFRNDVSLDLPRIPDDSSAALAPDLSSSADTGAGVYNVARAPISASGPDTVPRYIAPSTPIGDNASGTAATNTLQPVRRPSSVYDKYTAPLDAISATRPSAPPFIAADPLSHSAIDAYNPSVVPDIAVTSPDALVPRIFPNVYTAAVPHVDTRLPNTVDAHSSNVIPTYSGHNTVDASIPKAISTYGVLSDAVDATIPTAPPTYDVERSAVDAYNPSVAPDILESADTDALHDADEAITAADNSSDIEESAPEIIEESTNEVTQSFRLEPAEPNPAPPISIPQKTANGIARDSLYIQIGAFRDVTTAEDTIRNLTQRGHNIFVYQDSAQRSLRKLNRVLVGPVSKDEVGSLLVWIRGEGFDDAFSRTGAEL